jgi:hypothetical protein
MNGRSMAPINKLETPEISPSIALQEEITSGY